MTWQHWAESRNEKARAKNRWRQLTELDAFGVHARLPDGRAVTAFSPNDYLGLSVHPAVAAAAQCAIERGGTGAGASRLTSGSRPVHHELEAELAEWKSAEAALVFPTGYMANLGVLSAVAGPGVLICADAANHASIRDGCRLARSLGARVETYPHAATEAVEALLRTSTGRSVVVTDTVFSMDGDSAPVAQLAEICSRYGALLVLDEAHAVLGPHLGTLGCEVLRAGTLSKVLGSQGGFVAGSRAMVNMLVNYCRPFIFTTALAPATGAAALGALRVLRGADGALLLAKLAALVQKFETGHRPVSSPIIPFVIGADAAAVSAASRLLELGFFVPAVRPPTVPPGTSRLRVSVSAAHSEQEVDQLVVALAELGLLPQKPPTG